MNNKEHFLKNFKKQIGFVSLVAFLLFFPACGNKDKTNIASSGISNRNLGLSAVYKGVSLPANGTSKATILVEVWDGTGTYIHGASVDLSASLGTLASTTLTTSNGVASTTFTAGSIAGTAVVNAVMENATTSVKIILGTY